MPQFIPPLPGGTFFTTTFSMNSILEALNGKVHMAVLKLCDYIRKYILVLQLSHVENFEKVQCNIQYSILKLNEIAEVEM